MVFITGKCKRCGEFIQMVWDPSTETVRDCVCAKCGNKMTFQQEGSMSHHIDGIVSLFERNHFPFYIDQMFLK